MRLIETDTITNVNISGATAVAQYTADDAREMFVSVLLRGIAANGDYTVYLSREVSSVEYQLRPRTTDTVETGTTNIELITVPVPVKSGDLLRVYVDGLAGDTAVNGEVRWFEADYLRPTTAGQHDVDVDADGGVEVDSLQAGAITAAAIATGAIDADALAADAVTEIADAVDSSITVTLSQTPGQIANLVTEDLLTFYTHSKFSASLYVTGGISAGRDDFLLTIKTKQQRDDGEADSTALLQWSEDSGLLVINGMAPTELGLAFSDGTLTITNTTVGDVTTGEIALVLTAQAAAYLRKQSGLVWDGKEIFAVADNSTLKIEGTAVVKAAATQTIA